MEGYLDIPGSGGLRVTTAEDVSRSLAIRAPKPEPARRKAVTASATRTLPRADGRDYDYMRIRAMPWQEQALYYTTIIPELNFASRFYAGMISKLEIFPAVRGPDGDLKPIDAGLPVDLLNRVQDPGGGRAQLQGRYGRLMFATGEGQLFGRDLMSDDERWAFVWNSELQFEDDAGRIIWRPRLSSTGITYEADQAVAYRMWHPSPLRSGEAESPMQAALEVAEELRILTKSVRATAVSRILQGILTIPSEISPGAMEPLGDEDPENNPFMADLIEHMKGAVENAGTAEAAMPFVHEGAYEYLDKVKWMALHDPATDYLEQSLRKEAVERLARGFDFPPEILTGFAETNHWSAKQIMDQAWRQHGAPIAQQWCDDLNEAYLQPSLRDAQYPGWRQVVIGYDEADVIIRPDRGQTAIDLWNIGAVGLDAARKANGFDEDDAMSEREQEIWSGVKMRDPDLLPKDLQPAPPARGPTPEMNGKPVGTTPLPPGPDGTTRPDGITASDRIMAAAEMALLRCRELAGSRILSKRRTCPDCLKPAEDVPLPMVASVLGPDILLEIKAPEPTALVAGGAEAFRSWLCSNDVAPEQAISLAQMIENYAHKTLFDPEKHTLPSGFAAHVERVRELSG